MDPPGAYFGTPLVPGTAYPTPVAINPSGAIAGYYGDSSYYVHGFLRSRQGQFTVIDPPGSVYTRVYGMNPAGTVVGFYADDSGLGHCFVRSPAGTYTNCDPPGSTYTLPAGINPVGVATGSYDGHGFLFIPGIEEAGENH